jgi:hypothetical protein
MYLAGQSPFTTKNFQNYVIRQVRIDKMTGDSLVQPWMLARRFTQYYDESVTGSSQPTVEGAANGSEGALAQ